MADFTTANLIVQVTPDQYEQGVQTNQPIIVTFVRDMQSATFSDATVGLEVIGTIQRVPITIAYSQKVLTITPTGGLQPNTAYKLSLVGDVNPAGDALTNNITGIRDITGNGMVGVFTTEFKTGTAGVPATPANQLPVDQSSTLVQPAFSWTLVACDYFEIQASKSNSFETIFWPLPADALPTLTGSTITPARSFDKGSEYWWRVRAVSLVGGKPLPGAWSTPTNFYYGDPTLGSVNPEDQPLNNSFPAQPVNVSVYAATPMPGTANLDVYPATVTVTLNGTINTALLNASSMTLIGQAVDGEWDAQSAAPSFSPSLNGDMFGSGGIDYPAAVDAAQQITEAGALSGTPVASIVNGRATLTLTVPTSYWKPNNLYTVTLDLAELEAPVSWAFTSAYQPIFASVRSVREWTDPLFADGITDDEILYKIRHNSLFALWIQVFVPTQVDGQSWVYDPPVSFNVNNAPFFVRKYVELKTAHDFLRQKLWGLLGAGKTQLGDFSVDRQTIAVKDQMKLAFDQLERELQPYVDKLYGHTKRGYARGQWAIRGGGMFGNASTPGGFQTNDNSYLWPRSSRPKF